jgi:hypothetical protein
MTNNALNYEIKKLLILFYKYIKLLQKQNNCIVQLERI